MTELSKWMEEASKLNKDERQDLINNIDSLMQWSFFKKEFATMGLTVIKTILKTAPKGTQTNGIPKSKKQE